MPIVEIKKKGIDYLIEYLRPFEKFDEQIIQFTRVDDHYIHNVWNLLHNREHYYHIVQQKYSTQLLSYDSLGTLRYYLDDSSDPNYWKYYRAKDFIIDGEVVTKYRREDTIKSATYELIEVTLVMFDLEEYHLEGKLKVYFDNETNAMFLRTNRKVDVFDGISFDSEKFKLPNHHTFKMDFIDEEGWGDSLWDQSLKMSFNGLFNSFLDDKDRKVHLVYSPGSGKIPFYPKLINGTDLLPYRLVYPFMDGNQDLNAILHSIGNNFNLLNSLETTISENAILLEFKTVYGLLAFTKDLFFHSGYNNTINFDVNQNMKQFFEAYRELVNDEFKASKNTTNRLFKLFFFLPEGAIKLVDRNDLWDFIIISTQTQLTNFKVDKEDIVVKVLETLGEMYKEPTTFLEEFIMRKVDGMPLLEHLTYRLDGYNFTHFVELIRRSWKKSKYASMDESINPALKFDGSSPILIPYKSDKTIGFHHDNATIKWTDNYEAIAVILNEPIIKPEDKMAEEALEELLSAIKQAFKRSYYAYHPFAPLAILSEDNPEFIFKDAAQEGGVFQIMPAFILFAREQRAFWSNLATAGEYTADVLSFLSGYGNILKAGKLFKIFKAGEKLILKSKVFTKLAIGVRRASGYIEMTAGVGNALLKLSGKRDTEWGQKISQVLFYLEMAALAGEVTAALHGSIKKASLEALENTAEVSRVIKEAEEILLKNTDEAGNLKQIEEVLKAQDDLAAIKQLEEFAGVKSKKAIQFEEFLSKWKGKSILHLTNKEIADALKGFTEQANRVAKMIEEKRMVIRILDDAEFEKMLMEFGDSLEDARNTAAFCLRDETYYRASTPIEKFLSELVHEGTHAIDNASGFVGDIYQLEKRAFFYERAFQQASGIEKDFETIDEMIKFIYNAY